MSLRATSSFRVRYAETDQMGVVYHTHYLVWCEIGRTDFIRQFGATYAQLERDGLLLAVADAQVRYIASARYDETIVVETRLERAQSRLLTFGYEIFRTEPGPRLLVATALTKLIALDRNASPRLLPQELLSRFKDVQTIR
ncbi:MAG: acyl-CoA thioesterase [Gemmatimonadota bacterium]